MIGIGTSIVAAAAYQATGGAANTNLLLNSADFRPAAGWDPVVAGFPATYLGDIAGGAPDGSDTQVWLAPVTAEHKGFQRDYVAGAGRPVHSMYFKRSAGITATYRLRMDIFNVTTGLTYGYKFDWVDGFDPVASEAINGALAVVEDDGDGWWRLSTLVDLDMEGDSMTAQFRIDRYAWTGYEVCPWGAMAETTVGAVGPSAYSARGSS